MEITETELADLVNGLADGGPATIGRTDFDVSAVTSLLENTVGRPVEAEVYNLEVVFMAGDPF